MPDHDEAEFRRQAGLLPAASGPAMILTGRHARLKVWVSAVLALVLVGAGFCTLWYRTVYNVFPGQSASERVHWCGRDYEYQGPLLTRRQVAHTSRPLHAEGLYPPFGLSREELLAATYPPRLRSSGSCALLVFLRIGPDRYKLYSLEGGP